MKWISVEDRLPDDASRGIWDCVRYLCFFNNNIQPGVVLWINNRFDGFPAGSTKITHWQPLPEPPESE